MRGHFLHLQDRETRRKILFRSYDCAIRNEVAETSSGQKPPLKAKTNFHSLKSDDDENDAAKLQRSVMSHRCELFLARMTFIYCKGHLAGKYDNF